MKYIFLICAILISAQVSLAQNTFRAVIKNEETKAPIAGAEVSLKGIKPPALSGAEGKVELTNIADGERTILIFAAGFQTAELTLTFPLANADEQEILLRAAEGSEEVLITSTRTGRQIDDVPTRVEAIDEEEVDEKINMRPANVSMVLHESTGIQVQQTSATSATQSIRIQGLDGRYTQLLKDGFPAFGGFSGSLSILEIPPLDLKQVEIIKGPAATFYGGGAIAGVVNFISKTPPKEGEKPVTNLIVNQTSALGTDFSIFNSRQFKKIGYTVLGSVNYQKEYDVDDDDFTELPRTHSFNISPRVFFDLDEKTRLVIGNATSMQRRKGGDVIAIRGEGDALHRYFESNGSFRNITTINLEREFSGGRKLQARQSLAFFDRKIATPDYLFKGNQFNSYTDIAYFHPVAKHALVFGFNAVYDKFKETSIIAGPLKRDETRTTVGGYFQDAFDVTDKLSLEAGIRVDAVRDYGVFALPRVSLLYRFNEAFTTRLGFGLGYKTPSIFTEDAETLLFQNVLPVRDTLRAERSRGGTLDFNYRGAVGEKFSYSLNQMFFLTEITDPLVLLPDAGNLYRFINADSPIRSAGFETNARFGYGIAKLFIGYTFTRAKAGYLTGEQTLRLQPPHKVNSALVFEKHDNFKTGIEAYYSSSQFLSDGSRTLSFGEFGLFAEKTFGKISIFFNAENLTDVRQGRYGQVVFPTHPNPTFAEIYTHTEGRVFNGGIKVRF